ncbi:MAG TPA: hypothetical protein VGB95_00130, partial [Chitinophagales bacterium]
GFRFLVILFLLLLLLTPFLKLRHTETQKPVVALLVDKSESIRNAVDTTLLTNTIENLSDKLKSKYDVVTYSVGDKLTQETTSIFDAKSTNLSGAFEAINDIYYNRNLGAVVLASDGIFNQGINPIYSTENAQYSIYTLAVGDTNTVRDAKIENVYFNQIAYLNDKFAIKADVTATKLSGRSAKVSLLRGSNILESKIININKDDFYESVFFELTAKQTGVAHYAIEISAINGEISTRNNRKDIFVEVLDGRQKILLIANAAHPDIAALKAAIEANKNYSFEVQYANDFSAKINDYSLIILHQLPSLKNNAQAIISQIKTAKKPIWFILGSGSNYYELNKVENVVEINGNINHFNDVTASVNKEFSLFTLSEQTQNVLLKLPPLSTTFGDFKSNVAAKVLLAQKINQVATDFPLWSFTDNDENKTAVLAGEGLWRWKLHDYLQNKNTDAFNELVQKTIQFLAVETDKRPFRAKPAKTIFSDNESVSFDAQLYNANFEMVNTADVQMNITDENGKTYNFEFNKNESYYTLDAGFLPAGNYHFSASASLGNNRYKSEGKFAVAALQLEDLNTVADFKLLQNLASARNGKMETLQSAEKIADELLSANTLKPVLYDTVTTQSAIDLKWIFALLILLLSAEWFVRKWSGSY